MDGWMTTILKALDVDERPMVDQIARGEKVLLVQMQLCSARVTKAMLVDREPPHDGKLISTMTAGKLIAVGAVRPLAQFRWNHIIGWRELVGDLGEKWDVYLLMR